MTLEEASKWMEKGVVIVDHNTTYIDEDVIVGDGTTIYPNVSIRGITRIGKNNIIDSNTVICDCKIGDNNKILSSYLTDSKMGNDNFIGPFAHMRQNAILGNNNKLGNYVEVKDSIIGNNNFFSHLSYIGNSEVSDDVNFSGGAITANFDLIKREYKKTIIKEGAIIGSNSVLVAPITINKKAFVAAGSVITDNVLERELAIARARQQVIKDYIKEN